MTPKNIALIVLKGLAERGIETIEINLATEEAFYSVFESIRNRHRILDGYDYRDVLEGLAYAKSQGYVKYDPALGRSEIQTSKIKKIRSDASIERLADDLYATFVLGEAYKKAD